MRTIGSQKREPLTESGMFMVHDEDEHEHAGVILKSKDDGSLELWIKNDRYSGYVIEIDGVGYEFVRSL